MPPATPSSVVAAGGPNPLSQMVSSSPLVGLRPQPPTLTPSLARLYKESLINHVVNWPAETVERASQRLNEEHNQISNLAITRVSAELKMARSLVRLTEIQATLQEQRILFLRQQSRDLDSLKTRPAAAAAAATHGHSVSTPSTPVQLQPHHVMHSNSVDEQRLPSLAEVRQAADGIQSLIWAISWAMA